jgi:hypothetical protein
MYTIFQGESLLIPAVVVGDKTQITNLTVSIKASVRGEIPLQSAATKATMTVENYTSTEVTNGYLFKLVDSSVLTPGTYYVNYSYTISGMIFKGTPKKIVVKESVI